MELDKHSDEVWFLEFSHDGTRLATTGKDRRIVIYDVPSFRHLHTFTEHEDGVTYIAFSPDDTKLISCSQDHTAKVWDVEVRHSSLHTRLESMTHAATYRAAA